MMFVLNLLLIFVVAVVINHFLKRIMLSAVATTVLFVLSFYLYIFHVKGIQDPLEPLAILIVGIASFPLSLFAAFLQNRLSQYVIKKQK